MGAFKAGYAAFLHAMTRQYADFRGRTRRRTFWLFFLYYLLSCLLLAVVIGVVGTLLGLPERTQLQVADVLLLLTAPPTVAISARRLHDLGVSGWWALPSLLPALGDFGSPLLTVVMTLVGVAYTLVFLLPGQPGANRWGVNPKTDPHAQAVTP